MDPWEAQQANLAFLMSIQEKGDYLKQKKQKAPEKDPAGLDPIITALGGYGRRIGKLRSGWTI